MNETHKIEKCSATEIEIGNNQKSLLPLFPMKGLSAQ